jgi:hypothetical protein
MRRPTVRLVVPASARDSRAPPSAIAAALAPCRSRQPENLEVCSPRTPRHCPDEGFDFEKPRRKVIHFQTSMTASCANFDPRGRVGFARYRRICDAAMGASALAPTSAAPFVASGPPTGLSDRAHSRPADACRNPGRNPGVGVDCVRKRTDGSAASVDIGFSIGIRLPDRWSDNRLQRDPQPRADECPATLLQVVCLSEESGS